MGFGFNRDDYPASDRTYKTITPGEYNLLIKEATEKPISNNAGTRIELKIIITDDGEFKGQSILHNFNIEHVNSDTQRIAREQLSALCDCLAIPKGQESMATILNVPFVGEIVHRDFNGKTYANLKENSWRSLSNGNPPAQAAKSNTPPWKK